MAARRNTNSHLLPTLIIVIGLFIGFMYYNNLNPDTTNVPPIEIDQKTAQAGKRTISFSGVEDSFVSQALLGGPFPITVESQALGKQDLFQ